MDRPEPPRTRAGRVSMRERSLLLADALEGLAVLLHVHELPGLRIPLDPLLGHRVEDLGPVPNGTVSVPVALRWVRRHRITSLGRGPGGSMPGPHSKEKRPTSRVRRRPEPPPSRSRGPATPGAR